MADVRWRMVDGAVKAEAGPLRAEVRGPGPDRCEPQRSAFTNQPSQTGAGERSPFSSLSPFNARDENPVIPINMRVRTKCARGCRPDDSAVNRLILFSGRIDRGLLDDDGQADAGDPGAGFGL